MTQSQPQNTTRPKPPHPPKKSRNLPHLNLLSNPIINILLLQLLIQIQIVQNIRLRPPIIVPLPRALPAHPMQSQPRKQTPKKQRQPVFAQHGIAGAGRGSTAGGGLGFFVGSGGDSPKGFAAGAGEGVVDECGVVAVGDGESDAGVVRDVEEYVPPLEEGS